MSEDNMALAEVALAIPALPGVPRLTCHVATWYWAARAAQAAGQSTPKTPLQILTNIVGMAVPAQAAMLALPRAGNWNFTITPITPPVGSVLVWPEGGTHSAVVTGLNVISGYNQPAQFPHLVGQWGYTSASPAQLGAAHKSCVVVSEATIIARAAALDL